MKSKLIVAILAATTLIGGTASISMAMASHGNKVSVVQKPGKEHHPELRRALGALQRAVGFLQHADRDFGGHRTKAVELANQAISEVQAAIAFDKH